MFSFVATLLLFSRFASAASVATLEPIDDLRRLAYASFIAGRPIDPILCQASDADACSMIRQVNKIQRGTHGSAAELKDQALTIMDLAERFKAELGMDSGRPPDEVVLAYRDRRIGSPVSGARSLEDTQGRKRKTRGPAQASSVVASLERTTRQSKGPKSDFEQVPGGDADSGYFIMRNLDGVKLVGIVKSWKNRDIVWIGADPATNMIKTLSLAPNSALPADGRGGGAVAKASWDEGPRQVWGKLRMFKAAWPAMP